MVIFGSSFAKIPQYESVPTVETRIQKEEVPKVVHVSPVSENDLHCLVENAYFEARNQGTAGIIGVIHVTLNRAQDKRFPDNICDVVYQAKTKPSWKTGEPIPMRHQCQFSWYCDGKSDEISERTRMSVNFQQSLDAAYKVLSGYYAGMVEGATHYHADYVDPHWRHALTYVTKIDRHIFYRIDKENPA